MRRFALLGLLLLLIGCARETGNKIDPSWLSQLTKGRSTYTDVIRIFGQPTQVTTGSASGKRLTYLYRNESFDAGDLATAMFTPLGKENDQVISIVVDLDRNDIVQDFASSTTNQRH
jgi:hypothetical protein